MLRTDERALLVDLLTPPTPDHRLEQAVGTTFTMQLDSLLRIPLAVFGAEWTAASDPLGVMQAVRKCADRIDVFCQAGMLHVPAHPNPLLGLLEAVVHQVERPRPGRLFHPKVWLVSYVDSEGGRMFRLLCSSRNLTGDRAWDAIVSLEGVQTGAPRHQNKDLSRFIASLPDRVPNRVLPERKQRIMDLAEAVRSAEWEAPAGVSDPDWLTFHWLEGERVPKDLFAGNGRRMVVSPFLNVEGIKVVCPDGEGCVIVSRPESIAALGSETLEELRQSRGFEFFELDDGAALPDEDDEDSAVRWSLRGLHAKVFVLERGRRTHVFIGSANATSSAWGGNTEFVVEIVGPTKNFGVQSALADTHGGLSQILRRYEGTAVTEPEEPSLEQRLEWALVDVASQAFTATASVVDDGRWDMRFEGMNQLPAAFPEGAVLRVRLLADGLPNRDVEVGTLIDVAWASVASEDITPFATLELTAGTGVSPVRVSCVVLATLVGGPEDRLDRLIARQFRSEEDFLRFLLLLLQISGGDSTQFAVLTAGRKPSGRAFGFGSSGVLESLVAALADHPQAIDDIDGLVGRLSATEDGQAVLPEGWDELWGALLGARRLTTGIGS